MNFFNPRSLSLVAATAVLTAVSMVQTEAAHAFLITRTTASTAASVNPSLAAPTILDFNRAPGDVPTSPASVGSGANGGATIQKLSGSASYVGNQLQVGLDTAIGGNSPAAQAARMGTVSFKFDDPRGMGYFGFELLQRPDDAALATISFLRNGASVASFTIAQLLGSSISGHTLVPSVNGNYFNFFVTKDPEIFNEVRFADLSSANDAGFLRVDNVAYQAIPTPALLPGLVGVAFGAIRKRKAEAETEAEA